MRHSDSNFWVLVVMVILLGGYSSQVLAADQEVTIKPVGNQVLFDTEEITAKRWFCWKTKTLPNGIAT